jgi:hypothetical protein
MRAVAVAALLLCGVLAACAEEYDSQFTLEEMPPVPEHCDAAAPPPGVETVQVVFSCDEVPVGTWRALPDWAADTVRYALEALLAGPTAAEQEAGLASFFSDETAGMLNAVDVRDGVAYVDFRDFSRIIPNASTSAGSTQLLDQIAGTLFQFDGIHEAELTFDGSCDAFWEWLQRGCQRLQRGEP